MLYLDCSCLNLSLGIFLEFCDLSSIFGAFKTISRFSGIVYGIKNKFEKNLSNPFGPSPWARPPAPATPAAGHSRRPARGPSEHGLHQGGLAMPPPPSASVLGTPGAAPRPIMGDPQAPARPAPARRRRKTAPPATQRRRRTGPPWPTIAAPPSISAAAVYILPQ
jgi:hypothetical protein